MSKKEKKLKNKKITLLKTEDLKRTLKKDNLIEVFDIWYMFDKNGYDNIN
ncbi:MAG: hypothetical protein R6W84_18405 [Promethearchaeia archaeon]